MEPEEEYYEAQERFFHLQSCLDFAYSDEIESIQNELDELSDKMNQINKENGDAYW